MSDRGSFVTDYVYCKKCFDVLRKVLVSHGGWIDVSVLQRPDGSDVPIMAGKISGTGGGDELVRMEFDVKPFLDDCLCHVVRIAVLPEGKESRLIVCGPGEQDNVSDQPQKIGESHVN